jgi:hypothetical protein
LIRILNQCFEVSIHSEADDGTLAVFFNHVTMGHLFDLEIDDTRFMSECYHDLKGYQS